MNYLYLPYGTQSFCDNSSLLPVDAAVRVRVEVGVEAALGAVRVQEGADDGELPDGCCRSQVHNHAVTSENRGLHLVRYHFLLKHFELVF